MRFNLKIIAAIVLLSLILTAVYQGYWLTNFYREQHEKLEVSVLNALKIADLNELAMRMTDIQLSALDTIKGLHRMEKDGRVIYTIDKDSIAAGFHIDSIRGSHIIKEDSMFIVNPPDLVVRIKNERGQANLWNDIDLMNSSIQKAYHRVLDSLEVVDFNRYDSLLNVEFVRLGLTIPYALEYSDCTSDSVLESRFPEKFDFSKSRTYPFSISETDHYEYRLYLESPFRYVFKDMGGLVLVSLLMITILIISYLFLLRIIYRQKSIDEIKSDFTSNMTHELKTPISVVYAAVDALQNFGLGDDPEKREEYLSISKEQLVNLNNLVEQILAMSVEKRANLKIVPVEILLAELFDSIKNKFLVNASKDIHIDVSVIPENVTIKADKVHFSNLIGNLVENAIKYSKEPVCIKLTAFQEGNSLILKIEDNGIGIPPAALPKIFDRFYRVPSGNIHNVKGYGLGLAYVATIIEKHGWKIAVSSKEGEGTVFKIIV